MFNNETLTSHNLFLMCIASSDSKLVEAVVKDIVMKLNRECSSDLKGLIELESHIEICFSPQGSYLFSGSPTQFFTSVCKISLICNCVTLIYILLRTG